MTEDDLKGFKVLEFIEVEPDKLVWNDAGTGTWMTGPPARAFDRNFSDPLSKVQTPNVFREMGPFERPFERLGIVRYFFDHTLLENIGPESRTVRLDQTNRFRVPCHAKLGPKSRISATMRTGILI